MGEGLMQHVSDRYPIHVCGDESDSQKLRSHTSVMQVITRCKSRIMAVEQLIAAPTGEHNGGVMLGGDLGIEPAALDEIQVSGRLGRGLHIEEWLEADGRIALTLEELAIPRTCDETREPPFVHIRAGKVVMEAGQLLFAGESRAA